VDSIDLIDLKQLDFKAESGVWWDDRWETASSVSKVGRHNNQSLFTKGKLGYRLIPTLDHLADADLSNKGGVPVPARIKFLSIDESSYIMNLDGVTTLGEGLSISRGKLFDCNAHDEDGSR